MNKQIEVEGGELLIKNSHGDMAIIPKNKRARVEDYLESGCNKCLDNLVSKLPKNSDYAEDGSLYGYGPGDPPKDDQYQYYDNIPIYSDLQDFYKKTKSAKTSLDVGGRRETIPFYLSDKLNDKYFETANYINYNYQEATSTCNTEQCAARARRAAQSLYEINPDVYARPEDYLKSIGADFSTSYPPTEEQKDKYPYFKGDENFGSLDSWDEGDQVERYSKESSVYNAKDINQNEGSNNLSYNKLMKEYADKISLNSYFNLGVHADENENVIGGSHTIKTVGFYPDENEPNGYGFLVADYGRIVKLKDAMYVSNGSDFPSINSVNNMPGKEKFNYSYYKEKNDLMNTKGSLEENSYIEDLDNVYDPKTKKTIKASEEYKKFHNDLVKDKNYLKEYMNVSSEEYDSLAKGVLTIAANETEYGNGKFYKFTDKYLGSTTGLTQLNVEENLTKKDKKALRKYEGTEEYDNMASLLYAKNLDKYAKNWNEKSKTIKERPFVMQDYSYVETAKNMARKVIQGKNSYGLFESGNISLPNYYVDESGKIELPYQQFWQDDKDYEKEVNDYLKEQKKSDKYRFGYKNGKKTMYRKTMGNTKDLENKTEDRLFYSWNSPNSVYYGDASGNSVYYKQNKETYDKLFNKEKDK